MRDVDGQILQTSRPTPKPPHPGDHVFSAEKSPGQTIGITAASSPSQSALVLAQHARQGEVRAGMACSTVSNQRSSPARQCPRGEPPSPPSPEQPHPGGFKR